jgi:hypothetical protein
MGLHSLSQGYSFPFLLILTIPYLRRRSVLENCFLFTIRSAATHRPLHRLTCDTSADLMRASDRYRCNQQAITVIWGQPCGRIAQVAAAFPRHGSCDTRNQFGWWAWELGAWGEGVTFTILHGSISCSAIYDWRGWCSNNVSARVSLGTPAILTSSVPPAKFWDSTSIRWWLLPSKSFQIHYPSVVLHEVIYMV